MKKINFRCKTKIARTIFRNNQWPPTTNENMQPVKGVIKHTGFFFSKILHFFSSKTSVASSLGYSPIPREMIEYTKESIKIWLNGNILSTNIQSFPETIADQNGTQLFELLQFLAGGKNFQQHRATIEKGMKRSERCLILY